MSRPPSPKKRQANRPERKKKMKKIEESIEYVSFAFGSMAYVTVDIYEGKTFEECLKLRSPDIDGYVKNGKFVKV